MTVELIEPVRVDSAAGRRRWAGVWRPLVALAGGLVMDLGFPGVGWWPLTLVGVGMVLAAVDGLRFWRAAGVGAVAGMAFYLTNVSWSGLYLGPVPWLALSASQAISVALGCGLIGVASRLVRDRFLAYPLLVAGLWVAREEAAARWPYSGFSWGRVAFSHSEGPLAPLLSWVGASGLSFVLVALAAAGCQIVRSRSLPAAGGWAAGAVALALVPVWQLPAAGTITVGAVQGNGPAGYFTARDRGDLLAASERATATITPGSVDVVVWPEDGSDLDPARSGEALDRIRRVTATVNAPLIFGVITKRDDLYYNSSLAWEPGHSTPTDFYDKKRPVPFGEYVPNRAFWASLAPDLIGLVARDYVPGTREGVLDVGGMRLGSAICFDITADDVISDLPVQGAQLILAQSNNGDFGTTDESVQQLAIARIRALETGRDVVNISTVGTSAIMSADGGTLASLPTFEAGVMVQEVTLRDGLTPAIRLRQVLPLALAVISLLSLAALTILDLKRG
ncbi:apolipoprotein N-acyltransferase [Catenuloplanes sp. NPDC051500]|uniref:apolipoprotein N-acyltransferase n=1 Tax=Catenuloplanes sp. NPDC051500 TaxID=3363959 RepID=UPI0037BB87DC